MTILLTMYVGSGLLLAAIAIPLIRRAIPPNPIYGFRVRRTLDDPAIWYPTNAYAGICLFWLGLAIAVLSLAIYFMPGIDLTTYSLSCLAVMMVGLGICVTLSFRFLGQISQGKYDE
jgi:uncharacterized membrane protein